MQCTIIFRKSMLAIRLAVVAFAAFVVVGFSIPYKQDAPAVRDLDSAANDPDKYAWQAFVKVNAPANNGSNDALWETWATDDDVFPCRPTPKNCPPCTSPQSCGAQAGRNAKECPTWPGDKHRPKKLSRPALLSRAQSIAKTDGGQQQDDDLKEVVLRNWSNFHYIVSHELWFVEGQVMAYTKGDSISFPKDAIVVKAQYQTITEADKPRYHWNIDSQGRLMGLTALNIVTKSLPNWVWTAFEHIENQGRCDFIGCHDSFGQEPHAIPGKYPLNERYPAGRLTEQLLALFKQAGWSAEWQQQWKNYRLKGTQIDFTDSTGRPTLLGSSRIEAGFIPTSSCITCHAKSSISSPNMASPTSTHQPQRLATFQQNIDPYEGDVGPARSAWFWDSAGNPKFLQLDFTWGFQNACSTNPKNPCERCKD